MKQAEQKRFFEVSEINGVIRFVNECCLLNTGSRTKSKDIYEHYARWCDSPENQYLLVGKNRFGSILEEQLNKTQQNIASFRTNSHRGWEGIVLKSDSNDDAAGKPGLAAIGRDNPGKYRPKRETDPDQREILERKRFETVRQFITDRCIIEITEYSKATDLYKEFVSWTADKYPGNTSLLFGVGKFISLLEKVLRKQGDIIIPFKYRDHKAWRGIALKNRL